MTAAGDVLVIRLGATTHDKPTWAHLALMYRKVKL